MQPRHTSRIAAARRFSFAVISAALAGVIAVAAPAAASGPAGLAGGSRTARLGAPGTPPDRPATPGSPSIQYTQARSHAGDPVRFTSGPAGRVAVATPLVPRSAALLRPLGSDLRAATLVTGGAGPRREVLGFLPYWELTDPGATFNYDTLTTIAYFDVGVDRGGNLVRKNADGSVAPGWAGWTSSALTAVINAAHQQGVRVVLTLSMFGWSSGEAAAQGALLGSAAARSNLAAQAAQAVADRGADGINLDMEPIGSGHASDFTALVRDLRSGLDALIQGAQLTFDATAELGNYPVADATSPGAADAVLVMGYDYRTDGSGIAGSIAPLNGPTYDVSDTLAAYLALIPPSRLILGVPYYGRAWSTVTDAPNAATRTGTKYGGSASVPYTTAADYADQHGRRYDSLEESAWTAYQRQNCSSSYGCVTGWRELYYDDAQALAAKYALVNRLDLRGVGIWALGYDGTRPELANVLRDTFVTDSLPPVAGITALAPVQGGEAFQVSWAAVDNLSGVVSMDVGVSVDGGQWTPWLTGTAATSATFTGVQGHTYAFSVRATDGQGHTGDFLPADTGMAAPVLGPGGFAQVQAVGLQVRAGPDPTAQAVGSLDTGALVAITAGPVDAGGYTWFQVTEPVREWPAVAPVLVGVWVAAGDGSVPWLLAVRSPNSTVAGAAGGVGAPPAIAARLVGPPFISPNGDGRLDTVDLRGTAVGAVSWSLAISPAADPGGTAVRTVAGPGESVAATWDGRGEGGAPLPDGDYRLRLVAVNDAGIPASQDWIVRLDTAAPSIGLAVSPSALSPNGDGYAERATITVTAGESVSGEAAILSGSTVVRRFPLPAGAGPSVAWDGRNEGGRGVTDGRYAVAVTVTDAAGNAATARVTLLVDRTARLLRWSPTRFVPAGRGSSVSYDLARAATTTLVIRGPDGRSVRTAWSARSQGPGRYTWAWDGRNAARGAVPRGAYVAVLVVRTVIGTTTIMRTVVVQ
jgi:spore germination protein YaaH